MHANSLKPDPGSGTMPLVAGEPRKRVLFVDDDAAILEGLRAVLRAQRREWDMVFALRCAQRVRDEAREMLAL